MVAITDFQSCCTASIIYGFGEEGAADGAARRAFQENNTKEKMKASIVSRIKNKKTRGDGLITAILTDNQVMGAELLTELGFISSGWYNKDRHSENKIAIFYLGLKGWVEPVVQAQPLVVNPFAAPVAAPEGVEGRGPNREAAQRAEVAHNAVQARRMQPARDNLGRFARVEQAAEDFANLEVRIAAADNRPFVITYTTRAGRPARMGIINQKLRCASTNMILVATFNSMAHFEEVMGYTFEQAREQRRARGWSDLTVVYN
jgi:hypothetical protein